MSWIAETSQLLPARQQMAFTLGFHIVFACMGVGFPLITLVANWWGLRKNDEDALELARRWSKVMAVLFAVGAVTGTVLSFEMGLLWPRFMERFGDVFGIAFAIEGIFFFTEAIFIAIYIYGWKRLSPRAHLLDGRADRDRRHRRRVLGRGGQLVDEPADRVRPQLAGRGRERRSDRRALQRRDALRGPAHAARRVPRRRIHGRGRLRGRRSCAAATTTTTGSVSRSRSRSPRSPPRSSSASATPRRGRSPRTSRRSSPRWSTSPRPARTRPSGSAASSTTARSSSASAIPDLDSILVGFSPDTVVKGLDQVPEDERPPSPTLLHLAFDTMVGIGTARTSCWARASRSYWWRRNVAAEVEVVLARGGSSGTGGDPRDVVRLDRHRGRPPAVDRLQGDAHRGRGDGCRGIWFTFGATVLLYTALGAGTVYALRVMARRWREEDPDATAVPYGPCRRRTASRTRSGARCR